MSWPNPTTVTAADARAATSTDQQGLQRPSDASRPRLTVLRALDQRDATAAIAMVRRNQVVLINCSALEVQQAQRLIDMVCGGVLAMDGQVRQISPQVVLACSALTLLQDESARGTRQRRRQRR